MKKKYGHLFKSCSKVTMPLIHLGGKITCYGIRISYILVRVPNSRNVLSEFHSLPIGGHLGFLKTYHMVKKYFSWDGLKTDVQNFVTKCLVFQKIKWKQLRPPVSYNHFPFQSNGGHRSRWILSYVYQS